MDEPNVAADEPWWDEIVLPVLFAEGRKAYSGAIARSLRDAGYDDMPPHGARVVGGIARNGSTRGDLAHKLGLTKQAASQFVDALELKGYVVRTVDPADPSTATIELTERGVDAAARIRATVDRVDGLLLERMGPEAIHAAKAVAAALMEIDRFD